MNIKQNNNILKFNKKFKKLKKNIILKNLKLLFLKKYDVFVFANFNFYNTTNISIFKDILEKYSIKYTYVKSNDYKYILDKNLKKLKKEFNSILFKLYKINQNVFYIFLNNLNLGSKKFYLELLKEINTNKNSSNLNKNELNEIYNSLKQSIEKISNWNNFYFLNKNFNIILFLNLKNINNNVLETLKVYAKVDPLYLKFKTHNKLISYDYLINNLLEKNKNLNDFKLSICNLSLYNQIRILKILKIKNNL